MVWLDTVTVKGVNNRFDGLGEVGVNTTWLGWAVAVAALGGFENFGD
jgi:hypothetical protein